MHTSTVTPKGQVTIPAKLRHLLDLHPGDALVFEVIDRKIVIAKRKDDITATFGMFRVNKKVTLSDIQKTIVP